MPAIVVFGLNVSDVMFSAIAAKMRPVLVKVPAITALTPMYFFAPCGTVPRVNLYPASKVPNGIAAVDASVDTLPLNAVPDIVSEVLSSNAIDVPLEGKDVTTLASIIMSVLVLVSPIHTANESTLPVVSVLSVPVKNVACLSYAILCLLMPTGFLHR